MDRNSVSGRKLVLWLASTAVISGVGGAGLLIFATAAQAGVAMAGKVVSVEGNVLIRQDGKVGGKAQAMKPGFDVKEGDVINTASDGKAKIMLEDKTILDIGPSALFKVEKYSANHGGDRNIGLSMPYGTTRVAVSKPIAAGGKFQIRTRTATMGVRGTEFVVQSEMGATIAAAIAGPSQDKSGGKSKSGAADKASTKVTVIQGKVEVAQTKTESKEGEARKPAAAPAMLTAGMQVTSTSGASAKKPVKLDAAQISQVSAATTVTDNTFSNAVTLDVSSGSGGGSSDSGAGAATREAISVAIAAPQNQVSMGGPLAHFPGTFSPNSAPIQPTVFIPPGGALGLFKVHVVVTQ
jgi:hypothetical protein